MTPRLMERHAPRAAALAIALTTAMQASVAFAQVAATDPQLASARRGLLSDATAASRAGNHANALDLAERAGRIEMTPSLRVFIANEQATLGRISEALGSADLCVREVRANQQLHNAGSIEAECQRLITDLTPRVGRIVLHVPSPTPDGYAVHVGGTTINPAFYGAPYRVTPGHFVVELVAAGRAPVQRTVDVPPGGTVDVDATLDAAATPPTGGHGAIAAGSSAAPNGQGGTSVHGTTANTQPPSRPAPSGVPIAPLVVGGVGVLALGASAVLFGLRVRALNNFNATHCTEVAPNQFACDADAASVNAYHGIETVNTATFVTLGVGAAVVVGSALWFALSPRHRAEQSAPSVSLMPLQGGGMIGLGGAM